MPKENEILSLLLVKARESAVSCVRPILAKHEITEQQWRVIRVLSESDDINAQRLATESCILSPSLSRILTRLSSDGIIIRKADKTDQRAQTIRLSAKGRRLHKKLLPLVEKEYQTLTKNVGKDTVNRLLPLLQKYSEYQPVRPDA